MTHCHVRVVLNNLIDPMTNFIELVLTNVIRTDKEIEYLFFIWHMNRHQIKFLYISNFL